MKVQYFREQIFPILPESPGIYKFIDEDGQVLYVGKAKNLKNRVASYFNNYENHPARLKILLNKASNIEFTVVESEHDALLLENNLIKELQPRYNVIAKDDKSFPFIVIKNERFPRVYFTRRKINDGSEYLGPFTSVAAVKDIFEYLKSMYPIRTCNYHLSEENISKGKFRACLEYHIGNCLGPCIAKQDENAYNENINQIRQILKGHTSSVEKKIKTEMGAYASNYEFEKAEILKKRLLFLKRFTSHSAIVSPTISNIDVFYLEMVDDQAFVSYFNVINGSIIKTAAMRLKGKMNESPSDLLLFAILNLRSKHRSTANEIIVPFEPEFHPAGITFTVPQRGDKKKLLDLAYKNALEQKNRILTRLDKHKTRSRGAIRILEQLKSDFRMSRLPHHIECFDNSNFQGSSPVASTVVFLNGKPARKEYRHYNIKTVVGANDFASMEEVVYRRYRRLLEEKKPLPDLILIDGGKGQLNAAMNSLVSLGIEKDVTVAAIAKRLEEIYFPGDPIPLHINKQSPSLKLIQQVRNEAHRFAISFHRSKRDSKVLQTELTDIKGIGEKTAIDLLKEFRSIRKISELDLDELSEKVGPSKAKIIYNYFHSKKEKSPNQ